MGNFVEALKTQGGQATANLAGGILGQAWGQIWAKANDRRQLRQQERLQNLQIEGTKNLTDYQYAKELQMWKDTNYQAQAQQMRLAGLNPGLMYGMSGGGGTTTGSSGMGVTGAQAPSGGGELAAGAGMGMMAASQLKLMQAQKENIEADTEQKKVEAAKTAGVDTELAGTQIQSLAQGINNAKAQEALTKVQTQLNETELQIKNATAEQAIAMVSQQSQLAEQAIRAAVRENKLGYDTFEDRVKMVNAQLIGQLVGNTLTQAKTRLTEAEIKQVQQNIQNSLINNIQNWDQLQINWQHVQNESKKVGNDVLMNDTPKSTQMISEMGTKILQAIGLGSILKGDRTVIQGFKPKY